MLFLLVAVVLLQLEHQGVLPFFVVPLLQELFPDLRGASAEAHLVQLGHVVHQAHAAPGLILDQKVNQAHDPAGGLIQGEGRRRAVPPHGIQQAEPFGVFPREESEKGKAGEVKARHGQGVHRGAAARNPDDADALVHGGPDQLVPRVGDAGRPGVGDDRHVLPFLQLPDKPGGLSVLVELVVRDEAAANAQLVQQHHRPPRVLRRDQIGLLENPPAPGRQIRRIADGRGHDIKNTGFQTRSLLCWERL